MSGGSYQYAFRRVEEFASVMTTVAAKSPVLREAFRDHLQLVAKAMHDIEWVDSFDYDKGDEDEAIRACLNKTAELEATIKAGEAARDQLTEVIDRAMLAREVERS